MDKWCDEEGFGFVSSVPTPCTALSILIVLPSTLISLISVLHIRFLREQIPDSDAGAWRGWNQSLCVFLALSTAEVLFSIVFSVDDQKSLSLVVGIVSHCLAWLLLAVKAVYSLAATRHRLVIDLTSWGFFIVDFFGIGLLALAQYTEDRTTVNLAAAVCNFLLGIMVLLFSFYVQYLNGRQSYRRLKGGGGPPVCSCNCYDYLLSFLFEQRRDRYSFESSENRRSFWSIHSDTKSWWGNSSHTEEVDRLGLAAEPLLIDDATREGLLQAVEAGGGSGPVLSALERRMAKPTGVFDNGNSIGYIDGEVVLVPEPVVMTDVLQRALDRRKHKDRASAHDRITDDVALAPGSTSSLGGGSMQEFSVIIHRWALLREKCRDDSTDCCDSISSIQPTSLGAGDGERAYSTDVVIDLESGGSILEPPHKQHERRRSRARSGTNFIPEEFLSPGTGPPVAGEAGSAEVEFEICIRGGPCAEMEWWGRAKGIQPTLNKWTVWRTALQVEELHRDMLGLFGDLAPRRPRLHTSRVFKLSQLQDRHSTPGSPPSGARKTISPETPIRRVSPFGSPEAGLTPEHVIPKSPSLTSLAEESGVTREEIASDMRSIAGYLRAMLNQPTMHCTTLFEFLEVPDHLIGSFRHFKAQRQAGSEELKAPQSHSDSSSAFASVEGAVMVSEGSAIDDATASKKVEVSQDERLKWMTQEEEKWRKLYMNLRKGAKPREILRRCYVFEGCVSGSDIVKWLTMKGSIGSVKEAESIGEGLVNVGRLIPVCLGLLAGSERHPTGSGNAGHHSDSFLTTDARGDKNSSPPPLGTIVGVGEDLGSKFLNSPTYIYVYPSPTKSNPQRSKAPFSLFGDVISVTIPGMVRRATPSADEYATNSFLDEKSDNHSYSFELRDSTSSPQSDNISALRDAVRSPSPTSRVLSPRSPEDDKPSPEPSEGYIEYEIKAQNSSEEWSVFRRYKEFVALNRLLHKAGVRPKEPLPSQFLGRLTQQNNPKRLEERRVQLQSYLRSAVTAVVQAHIASSNAANALAAKRAEPVSALSSGIAYIKYGSGAEIERAMVSLAKFLDKEFDKLRLVQSHKWA